MVSNSRMVARWVAVRLAQFRSRGRRKPLTALAVVLLLRWGQASRRTSSSALVAHEIT